MRAQDDDPKRTAAAVELLGAMHAEDLLKVQREGLKKAIAAKLPKTLSADARKQVEEKIAAGLDPVLKDYTWESVKPEFVALYAHAFTESELKELTAFYNSPIGKKFIEKRAEVEVGGVGILDKHLQTFMPDIAGLVHDALAPFVNPTPYVKPGSPLTATPSPQN